MLSAVLSHCEALMGAVCCANHKPSAAAVPVDVQDWAEPEPEEEDIAIPKKAVVVKSDERQSDYARHPDSTPKEEHVARRPSKTRVTVEEALDDTSTSKLIRTNTARLSHSKSFEDEEFIRKSLETNEKVQQLIDGEDIMDCLVGLAHKKRFKQGDKVVSDNGGHGFCIVVEGLVKVVPEDSDVEAMGCATLSPGSSSGETALFLPAAGDSESFIAEEDSVVWFIDKSDFNLKRLEVLETRVEKIAELLNELDLFLPCSEYEKLIVARSLSEARYEADDVLFMAGDEATHFYVLLNGSVDLLLDGELAEKFTADDEKGSVTYFGDRALLAGEPRRNTAKVSSSSVRVLELDRDDFMAIVAPMPQIVDRRKSQMNPAIRAYLPYIEGLAIFGHLTREQKESIAKALQLKRFKKGQAIFKMGDSAETFYVLLDGDLDVQTNKGHLKSFSASSEHKVIQYFGERALRASEARLWTVKVVSESARVLALARDHFRSVVGLNENYTLFQEIPKETLTEIGLIGSTPYGPQHLYLYRAMGQTFIMSRMNKGLITQLKKRTNVVRQKDLWEKMDSPFMLKLYKTYNEPETLYFLSEVAQGGSLSNLYAKRDLYGKVSCTQYYVACATLGVLYMHSRRIIHRDLKPENIFITARGQAKIGGLTVAKYNVGKTHSTCGTPEYMAPETLMGTGHNKAVDWWAIGVTTFELMVGFSPFRADSPLDVYGNVARGFKRIQFPESCTSAATSFIQSCCRMEPGHRLGMRPAKEPIKEHDFFDGFAWDQLEKCMMDPPFKPHVEGPADVSHFRADVSQVPKPIPYKDDGSGWDKEFGCPEKNSAAPNCS